MELKTIKHNPDVIEFRIKYSKVPLWVWVPLDFFFPTILFAAVVLLGVYSIFFWSLMITIIVLRIWVRKQVITEEFLIVMRGLGVQLGSVFVNGKSTQQFIEKKQIKNLIINEGIKSYKIVYYLAFMVEGKDKLVIPFQVCSVLVSNKITRVNN